MTPTAPQSWHVLGAGSIGLLFAFYLRKAGHDVTLILRNEAAVQSFNRSSDARVYLLERWRQAAAQSPATADPPSAGAAAANGVASPTPIRWQASERLHAVSLHASTSATSSNPSPPASQQQQQQQHQRPSSKRSCAHEAHAASGAAHAAGGAAAAPAGSSGLGRPIQHLVLATKAPDAVPALRSVLPHLAPSARCLLLQNGALAVADELRRELGAELGLLLPRRQQQQLLLQGSGGGEGAGGGGNGGGNGSGASRTADGVCGGGSSTEGMDAAVAAVRGDVRLYLGSVTHGCYRAVPGPTGPSAPPLLLPMLTGMGAVSSSSAAAAATEPPTAGVMSAVATGAAVLPVLGELGDRSEARGVVHAGRGAVTLGPLRPLLAELDARPGGGGSDVSGGCGSSSSGSSSSSIASETADDAAFIAQLAASVPELGIRGAGPGAAAAATTTTSHASTPRASPAAAEEASAAAAAAARALLCELHLKLAVNAAINPLGALLGVPNGRLLAAGAGAGGGGHSRALMRAVCGELVAVFGPTAFGYGDAGATAAAAAAEAEGRLYARVCAVAAATAANRCSMLADVDAGRRTEVDYLTGWVLAAAAARGLEPARAAPTNATLYALVKAKEEAAEAEAAAEAAIALPWAAAMGVIEAVLARLRGLCGGNNFGDAAYAADPRRLGPGGGGGGYGQLPQGSPPASPPGPAWQQPQQQQQQPPYLQQLQQQQLLQLQGPVVPSGGAGDFLGGLAAGDAARGPPPPPAGWLAASGGAGPGVAPAPATPAEAQQQQQQQQQQQPVTGVPYMPQPPQQQASYQPPPSYQQQLPPPQQSYQAQQQQPMYGYGAPGYGAGGAYAPGGGVVGGGGGAGGMAVPPGGGGFMRPAMGRPGFGPGGLLAGGLGGLAAGMLLGGAMDAGDGGGDWGDGGGFGDDGGGGFDGGGDFGGD
ncbi:hypothetical protein HYH02_000966 [Chlamydomonas schloesseri]|uniref:Uncharacterized protein n=1 Tax=Chlamydomonas schloesseri TaxID=2026947 RepID=A0A835WXW0_9CHLO|nr:hypothetical protein HYH02_000966 [Chlamydomonas schloesseri]|eukprot:KAG2455148.1 hypothetical protein HYH02_000966 [Chlamydomonas schloesseri]